MNKGGRPTKLTDRVRRELLDAFSKGAPISMACGRVGISEACFYSWMQMGREGVAPRYVEFLEKVTRAREQADFAMLEIVRNVAAGEPCVICQGTGQDNDEPEKKCSQCRGSKYAIPPDGKLALDYLARRRSKDFARRTKAEVQHTGPGGGPVQVMKVEGLAELTAEQLTALAWGEDEAEEAPQVH